MKPVDNSDLPVKCELSTIQFPIFHYHILLGFNPDCAAVKKVQELINERYKIRYIIFPNAHGEEHTNILIKYNNLKKQMVEILKGENSDFPLPLSQEELFNSEKEYLENFVLFIKSHSLFKDIFDFCLKDNDEIILFHTTNSRNILLDNFHQIKLLSNEFCKKTFPKCKITFMMIECK